MGRHWHPAALVRAVAAVALVLVASVPVGEAGARPGATAKSAVADLCSPCGSAPGGRPAGALIAWWDVTNAQFGTLPPAGYGATLAYDPVAQQAVWFGGCELAIGPTGSTWTYSNGSWSNRSSNLTVAPAARCGAMSDFDPNAGSVVVFGGYGGNGSVNDTWTFHGGAWSKVPLLCDNSTSPTRACVPTQVWSGFSYDPAAGVRSSVLFGGCADAGCNGFTNGTYWFNGSTGLWSYHTASPGSPNPSRRTGAAMAYDPVIGGLVLFGGRARCPQNCTFNDTWIYANGSWTNVSSTFGSGLPSRAYASMSWDAAQNELVLAGGIQDPAGTAVNSTSTLRCTAPRVCHWSVDPTAGGPAVAFAATDPNPAGLNPWRIGGVGSLKSGAASSSILVYSALPDLNIAVAPSRPEVSQPVYLNATAVGSLNPMFVFRWGDGTGLRSGSGIQQHVYPVAGAYNAAVAVIDPNGSANYHSVGLIVVPPPTGTIVVEYRAVDVGVPDHFTAVPTLATGTPPFNFTWNFGAPPTLFGASVVRTFATPGSYPVNVSMVDNSGLRGWSTATVNVSPALTLTVAGQYTLAGNVTVERLVPVSFDAKLVGGTPSYNFTWSFGDGGSGWGPGPVHPFDTASSSESVQVVVADAGGGTATGSLTVRIVPSLAVAGLSETPGAPTTGAPVQFHVDLTGGGGAETYAWTFGDGVSSVGDANASHIYATPGTYTATVYVTDSIGGTTTQSITITVTDSPVVGLEKALSNPWAIPGLALLVGGGLAIYLRTHPRRPRPAPEPDANPP
jgi:PKD domain-containing protein